ncbi:MAG: class I SAM-dependent methyltransferase [Prevotellaceae bacterium]|jgi:2-polyprenyl-3-methyl-5-hydroxy-6-metoxy-1,4-benzoquinol methylase|nr:class I SAM-dependent methyltransferase [Prevotellaceae bacterium]
MKKTSIRWHNQQTNINLINSMMANVKIGGGTPDERVIKNKFGFYELTEKPSEDVLKKYYEDLYYQNETGTYQSVYNEDEKRMIQNKIKRIHFVINRLWGTNEKKGKLLDIGCGEGWVLQHFYNHDWDVKGIDYSSHGIKSQNPAMLPFLCQGDIYNLLNVGDQKYDVIWLACVLEHVLEPKLLLTQVANMISPDGILIITVPNDFSVLQQKLLEKNYIDTSFWIASPDHISYFNKDGLENLCSEAGMKKVFDMTEFPIDFNLANMDSNYVRDKSKGKNVHLSRVFLENLLDEISMPKTVELYKALAELGLGREIISFFTPV